MKSKEKPLIPERLANKNAANLPQCPRRDYLRLRLGVPFTLLKVLPEGPRAFGAQVFAFIRLDEQVRPLLKCKNPSTIVEGFSCPRRESNPHSPFGKQDFKSCASTSSATRAKNQDQKKIPSTTVGGWNFRERKTRLEPATSTLARLRSTN